MEIVVIVRTSFELPQDTDQWRDRVNTVPKRRVIQTAEDTLH
jgi:hypothetical protein